MPLDISPQHVEDMNLLRHITDPIAGEVAPDDGSGPAGADKVT
jgi:hypothetical protein